MPHFRRLLLGRRLATEEVHQTKLSNFIGLSVFSSDALSSTAYATQETMASLSMAVGHPAVAGTAAAARRARRLVMVIGSLTAASRRPAAAAPGESGRTPPRTG